MKYLRNSLLVLVLAAAAPAQTVAEAGSEAYLKSREIGRQLKCQCSCSYTIADCNMLHCPFRESVTPDIKEAVAAGLPAATIVKNIIAKYGSQLRTAPRAEGFGLFGWAMPFVAILLGLIAAPILIWRWKTKFEQRPAPAPAEEADMARYQEEIERDLAKLE